MSNEIPTELKTRIEVHMALTNDTLQRIVPIVWTNNERLNKIYTYCMIFGVVGGMVWTIISAVIIATVVYLLHLK